MGAIDYKVRKQNYVYALLKRIVFLGCVDTKKLNYSIIWMLSWPMSNGKRYCQSRKPFLKYVSMQDATCVAFLKPCFRLPVRERSGDYCPNLTVNGTLFTGDSIGGAIKALLKNCSSILLATAIWSICWLIRPSYARTLVPLGRKKKHGAQSLGRSRGGHSTKIHLACDALGNAIRFILTGGEQNNITEAESLIENLSADYVLADKGYNSEALVLKLEELGSDAIIPSRANRKRQRVIDRHLYKERHLIECYIGKLKHFRRVFSKFDKLAKNYLSFVQFASTIIWLR